VTFAVAAILVATVPGTFMPKSGANGAPAQERAAWHVELRQGVRWLWAHPLLRPMAIILGCINALGAMSTAVFVLFAQEILGTGPFTFALLGTGAAVGGILGGWLAERVTKRIGPGPSLWITLFVGGVVPTVTGLLSQWPLVWLVTAVGMFTAVLWNVITVSLRQSIIPDHLLGRVNSVYRFFAWGSIPIGALLGGLITTVADGPLGREWALRLPWLVSGALGFVVLVFAAPKLTTEKIEAARAAG
jgi:MFS family permease